MTNTQKWISPTLTKISSPEAALVKYYDNRLRKLQGRNEMYNALFIIVIVAILSFVLITAVHAQPAKDFRDMNPVEQAVEHWTYPNYLGMNNPHLKDVQPEPCPCETDLECMDLCGGDGGPSPYNWDEIVED